MFGFLEGCVTGVLAVLALGGRIMPRSSKRKRKQRRAFAAMQTATFAVEDAVAMGLSDETCNSLRAARDRAAAAYFLAIGVKKGAVNASTPSTSDASRAAAGDTSSTPAGDTSSRPSGDASSTHAQDASRADEGDS